MCPLLSKPFLDEIASVLPRQKFGHNFSEFHQIDPRKKKMADKRNRKVSMEQTVARSTRLLAAGDLLRTVCMGL
jgi:hypothetical protein